MNKFANKKLLIVFGCVLLSILLAVTITLSYVLKAPNDDNSFGNNIGGNQGGIGGGDGSEDKPNNGGNTGDNGSSDSEQDDDIKRPSKFNVGYGTSWKNKRFVPYVDLSAYSTNTNYTYNGVLNLQKIYQETGISNYHVGFIEESRVRDDKKYEYVDGKQIISWSFGGYATLSEFSSDKWQYGGIKRSISELREVGGDVAISIGGYEGVGFFGIASSSEIYENTYRHIIDGFGLTRLDLDIEESAQYYNHTYSAKALYNIQKDTPIEIVLTLPVSPNGFNSITKQVIRQYLQNGIDIEIFNIMTMCFGGSTDYSKLSISAIDNAMNDLKGLYREIGVNITDSKAYEKLGFTTSIGYTSGFPIFTTAMTENVLKHATNKNLSLASYWSINRDSAIWKNSGIYSKYEHTNVYKKYYM